MSLWYYSSMEICGTIRRHLYFSSNHRQSKHNLLPVRGTHNTVNCQINGLTWLSVLFFSATTAACVLLTALCWGGSAFSVPACSPSSKSSSVCSAVVTVSSRKAGGWTPPGARILPRDCCSARTGSSQPLPSRGLNLCCAGLGTQSGTAGASWSCAGLDLLPCFQQLQCHNDLWHKKLNLTAGYESGYLFIFNCMPLLNCPLTQSVTKSSKSVFHFH